MAEISFGDAMLILRRWKGASTPLFIASSGQPTEFQSRASIDELTEGGVLLKAPEGGAQFRIVFSRPEPSCWYFEPREFAHREEFKEWLAILSEGEKFASSLGFSFSVRATSRIGDLDVALGMVVLAEVIEDPKNVDTKSPLR